MTPTLAGAVAAFGVAAVVVLIAGGLRTGRWRSAAELALMFVIGGGTVALTGDTSWPVVGALAVLVAIEAIVHRHTLRVSRAR